MIGFGGRGVLHICSSSFLELNEVGQGVLFLTHEATPRSHSFIYVEMMETMQLIGDIATVHVVVSLLTNSS